MNALSNPRVAEFINDHFIATYMKVGTFQIINGEKVGGNVASYFCLPDSTVVHAVPGKTDARTLLSEAHFALETRKSAMTLSTDLVSGRTDDALYAAHVQKAHAERFLAEARPQWRGRGVNAERMQHLMPTTLPRNLSQQAQAEWLLARNPLERLHVLYPVVWTNILNEQLSTLPVARQ